MTTAAESVKSMEEVQQILSKDSLIKRREPNTLDRELAKRSEQNK